VSNFTHKCDAHIGKSQENFSQNILFRADSSSTIGTGHIMRDLVLAGKYKDADITFAVRDLAGNINYKIKEAGYKIEILKSNDIDELDLLIKKLQIDLLVIDHYDISYEDEKRLKTKNQKLKILSFDDTYERHYCDILLNHNISADVNKYNKLVLESCEIRCGSRYTLLRDEFYEYKRKKRRSVKTKRSKIRVFLAMGGADHSNINIKILKVVERFNDIEVFLVTTSANRHLKELKNYCKSRKWIKLHIDSDIVAKLMGRSDFAIVTPSVTLNEIYFMDIPFIAIKTADNQEDMFRYIKRKRREVLKRFHSKKLESAFKRLIKC
jgi:UDP-2,4-diacetamido-2,4,6-trideoxy-beta-L-altropyranose hydrolase